MSILVLVQKGDNIAKIETLSENPEGRPLIAFETSTIIEAILAGTDVTMNEEIITMIEKQNEFISNP